ncbi:MAG: HDOD domain-containing protein [Phycisphaerales bacterium]|nr:MAG: HDOD domain-containing protein [Phycisphaerales bacterium]
MKASVLETIKKSAAVPSIPQVVLRFLEIMQDPHFEYYDLVKVLSADAGTVSEVLRLANSALFGVRNKIVSLQHALTLLGPKRVRSLLLGRYLVDSMSKKQVNGLDMRYFWRRSFASSVVASHFAHSLLPHHRDEASIGAVLADIGIPILAEAFPDKYRPILARYAPNGDPAVMDDELEAVEVTHGQVSAMVLAHWKLPETVTNAVNLHQSANPGEGNIATIGRILNASDRIGRILCEVPTPEEIISVCTGAISFVAMDMDVLAKLLPTIENDIEELADTLRIDVIPNNIYALIAQTLQEHLSAPATG